MASKPKQVLIAHQNSIPHYRVRFYEILEARRPRDWEFRVVFDKSPDRNRRFFSVDVDPDTLKFPILNVRTYFLHPRRDDVLWQTFFWAARTYDVVVTDTYLKNITYSATLIWRLTGKHHVFWGHAYDHQAPQEKFTPCKRFTESLKQRLVTSADFFFAYTSRERDWLVAHGWPQARIITLNNTIDVTKRRRAYESIKAKRGKIRDELGLRDQRVLVYVGRLIRGKRVEFLLEAFRKWRARDQKACLIIVGGGEFADLVVRTASELPEGALRFLGPLSDEDVSRILIASDLYCIPGSVGLAPLTAMCYDLPVIAFDLPINSPEVEYLTPENSVIIPNDTTPEQFAEQLPDIFEHFQDPARRARIYPSISHLTLEAMADRFIEGINRVLALK